MSKLPPHPGISRFGQTANGAQVERIVLCGGGLTAAILTRGATLQGLWLQGIGHSLTIGLDTVQEYEAASSYLGALVGPVANRISGAQTVIHGRPCRLDANENGMTTLHSGPSGIHARHWQLVEMCEQSATLALDLRDGEGGLPGNRRLTARYSLPGNGCLRLDLSAATDAATPVSLAQHSYWNLDGTAEWPGHRLMLSADTWLPVDAANLPTGEVRAVAGAMDFRTPRVLRPGDPALDVNYCLSRERRPLAQAATLTGASGTEMQLFTTEPGLQVYDGRGPVRPGNGRYEGLALEPQGWPDAVNRAGFPSVVLHPGASWHQETEWRFRAVA